MYRILRVAAAVGALGFVTEGRVRAAETIPPPLAGSGRRRRHQALVRFRCRGADSRHGNDGDLRRDGVARHRRFPGRPPWTTQTVAVGYFYGPGDPKYACNTAGVWQVSSVVTGGIRGRFPSLALDASDSPHVAWLWILIPRATRPPTCGTRTWPAGCGPWRMSIRLPT